MLATSTHVALADQYLDRLAFGWQRRNQALDSHVLDAAGLSAIDRDLQSYSRGLELIGTTSSTLIHAKLLEPLTRGELFSVALNAICIQDQVVHNACIGLTKSIPTFRAAYIAALEWSLSDGARWAISQWQQQTEIQNDKSTNLFDVIALSACRYHAVILDDLCKTSWWSEVIKNNDEHADSGDTLCALMQLGLATAQPQAINKAEQLLQSPVARLRCLAAEVMLWQPTKQSTKHDASIAVQKATDVLLELSTEISTGDNIVSQASYALACWNYTEFDLVLTSLATRPENVGLYLQALGWSGNCQVIPTLINYLDHPEHARGAGAALSMLTGSLPARDSWQADPDDGKKRLIDVDPVDDSAIIPAAKLYANLPPPDRAGFERWWTKNRMRFTAQSGWLAGMSDTNDNLITVLQQGKLSWRALAARRLHARQQGGTCLNTNAPTPHQHQWISTFIASKTKTKRNAA